MCVCVCMHVFDICIVVYGALILLSTEQVRSFNQTQSLCYTSLWNVNLYIGVRRLVNIIIDTLGLAVVSIPEPCLHLLEKQWQVGFFGLLLKCIGRSPSRHLYFLWASFSLFGIFHLFLIFFTFAATQVTLQRKKSTEECEPINAYFVEVSRCLW